MLETFVLASTKNQLSRQWRLEKVFQEETGRKVKWTQHQVPLSFVKTPSKEGVWRAVEKWEKAGGEGPEPCSQNAQGGVGSKDLMNSLDF